MSENVIIVDTAATRRRARRCDMVGRGAANASASTTRGCSTIAASTEVTRSSSLGKYSSRPLSRSTLSTLVGVGSWLSPSASWRTFGLGPLDGHPSAALATRLFGARDLDVVALRLD